LSFFISFLVDIGGIDDHHCFNFLFIIHNKKKIMKETLKAVVPYIQVQLYALFSNGENEVVLYRQYLSLD
jgi:hypothetical protein